MDLEGLGASLLGRVILVSAAAGDVWIPSEFLAGSFSCSILITGGSPVHRLETERTWSAVMRPMSGKEWSCIATMIRGMGGSILLAFDVEAPPVPDSFVAFLDGVVAEGRIVLTRLFCGLGVRVPAIPDAIFFPVLRTVEQRQAAYDLLKRVPGRSDHGPWSPMAPDDWTSLLDATVASAYGTVLSDVGESRWVLFWHKPEDSLESKQIRFQKGFAWIQTGMRLLEESSFP